jgi:hypothetical protein
MDEERKRALKKQVRDQERREFLSAMPMTFGQATSLIQTLDARLEKEPCDHTLRFTTEWSGQQGLDPDVVTRWTSQHGGYCDCEVAANLADAIEDAGKLQND